jgi:hypothetical protein
MSSIGFINRCAICGKHFGSESYLSREEATALVLRGVYLNKAAVCSGECHADYREMGTGPNLVYVRPIEDGKSGEK